MRQIVAIASLFIFSHMANAAERIFDPVPSQDQRIEYENGNIVLLAQNNQVNIAASYVPRDKKSAWIKIGILNVSEQPLNFTYESISATSNGLPLKIMTYEDRIKEQRRKEAWNSVAAGLNAAANSMSASNAGYQQHSGTFSGTNSYGSNGNYSSGNFTGNYYGSTYDAGAAQRAQQVANDKNEKIFEQQRMNSMNSLQDIEQRALKSNTLSPQEFIFGDIRFDLPKKSKENPIEFSIVLNIMENPIIVVFREKQ